MSMRRFQTLASTLLATLTIFGVLACSRGEPEPPPPTRIENEPLALAVATVPPPFVVVSSDGPTIELEAPGDAGPASLWIEASAEAPGGINLVAEAEAMQDWFEQQPEGRYYGNLELGTPNGPAFTARGSYLDNGTEIEELRVFALHPSASRMLRLTYRYTPGEGKQRLQELAEVLGEIEALADEDQNASVN